MKPITPIEAEGKRIESIDTEMIQAVNELIVENLKNGQATVYQAAIVKRYCDIVGETSPEKRKSLFDRNQLDFEDIFIKAGWRVEYDMSLYNESYEPYYTFKSKKRKLMV